MSFHHCAVSIVLRLWCLRHFQQCGVNPPPPHTHTFLYQCQFTVLDVAYFVVAKSKYTLFIELNQSN